MDVQSVEWGSQCYTLDQFLHTYTLPQIVRVRDGYLDVQDITTLSTDQVMVLHYLKPCKMLKGFRDNLTNPEISIPLNTEGTIEILPQQEPKVYNSVKELKKNIKETKSNKFLSLNSDASLGVKEQDVLHFEDYAKLRGKEVIRCSVVNRNHKIVQIPTSYKASFLSYEEPKKIIPIKEAGKHCIFPCYVKIHGRAPIKPDYDPDDSLGYLNLSDLGRIKLVGVYDHDKIIASIRHSDKVRIMQFPLNLPITISTGKDVNEEDSHYNHLCSEVHKSTQFQQMNDMDYECMKMGYSECKVENIYEYIDMRSLKLPVRSSRTTVESLQHRNSKLKLPPPPTLPKPRKETHETADQYNAVSSPSPTSSSLPLSSSSSYDSFSASSPALSASSSSSTQQADTQQISYEIPKDLTTLTVEEVADCLKYLHMEEYAKTFVDELIDGELLMELTEDVLEDSLGVTNRFHRKKLMMFVQGWRPK